METKSPKELKNEIAKKATESLQQEAHTAITKKNIADSILNQFNELQEQGQLVFPKDYPIGNQLKLIYATIVDKGLQTCEPLSVANSIVETVLQGLDVSRTQCYYISYGGKCTMFRSYFGDVTVAKRTGIVKDIFAKPIYEGDEFELSSDVELSGSSVLSVSSCCTLSASTIGSSSTGTSSTGISCNSSG